MRQQAQQKISIDKGIRGIICPCFSFAKSSGGEVAIDVSFMDNNHVKDVQEAIDRRSIDMGRALMGSAHWASIGRKGSLCSISGTTTLS